jgi:hypothetical protein
MAKPQIYRSGFCSTGLHEGTKPKSPNGVPNKVCIHWEACGCQCHVEITKMFDLTGLPRLPQQNPEYKPDHGDFVMPSVEERVISAIATKPLERLESPTGTPRPVTLERDAAGILPPMVTRSFAPTVSGRAARGELEAWVRQACNLYAVESELDPDFKVICTPPWISKEIEREHGVKAPSTGAIASVLDRWVKIGYAVTGTKPTRFIRYTEDGIKKGLEVMKLESKQKAGGSSGIERLRTKRGKS